MRLRRKKPDEPPPVSDETRERSLAEYRAGWREADRDRKAAFRQLIGVEQKLHRQVSVNEDRKRQIGRLQRQLRDADARRVREVEHLHGSIDGLKEQIADLEQQLAMARAASALVPSPPVIPERYYGAPVAPDPYAPFIYSEPAMSIDGQPINGFFTINGASPPVDKPV